MVQCGPSVDDLHQLHRLWHFVSRTLFVKMVLLHFSLQGEDILEYTNVECHLCTLLINL